MTEKESNSTQRTSKVYITLIFGGLLGLTIGGAPNDTIEILFKLFWGAIMIGGSEIKPLSIQGV